MNWELQVFGGQANGQWLVGLQPTSQAALPFSCTRPAASMWPSFRSTDVLQAMRGGVRAQQAVVHRDCAAQELRIGAHIAKALLMHPAHNKCEHAVAGAPLLDLVTEAGEVRLAHLGAHLLRACLELRLPLALCIPGETTRRPLGDKREAMRSCSRPVSVQLRLHLSCAVLQATTRRLHRHTSCMSCSHEPVSLRLLNACNRLLIWYAVADAKCCL
jgi:hypothetical protein